MTIATYTNPYTGETLYASQPVETNEFDGNVFLRMSFTRDLKRTFWYNKDAVKLVRVEE